jgi:hypothetical protein
MVMGFHESSHRIIQKFNLLRAAPQVHQGRILFVVELLTSWQPGRRKRDIKE